MTLGLLFYILMLFWLIFGLWSGRADFQAGRYEPFGGNLLLFVLLLILGWGVFGSPIK